MTKPRLTAYLSRSVADRLELACKRPGANKSALVEKALDRLLNPERDQQGEAALIRRLDRMSKQLGEINRNQQIVVESLALFVRYYLTITPPLPKSEQEPARSLGNQRFEFFVAQVGRRLAGGQNIVSEVLERIVTHDPDLFARDLDETQMMPKAQDPREKPRRRTGKVMRPRRRELRIPTAKERHFMDRTVTSFAAEALERRKAMLKTAFGTVIAEALAEPQVVEVMVNPDGRLWLDRLDTGRHDTGTVLQWSEVERIIRLVASHIRLEVHERSPIVSAELPETGERFEGLIPPVAPGPCFSIRKPARLVHRLDDYVDHTIMSSEVAAWLKEAVLARGNIVIVGGTSSGKTTLVNALLAEIATSNERVVILEDTRELNCAAADCVKLRTKPGVVSLSDLVRSTMRLRPDRIVVGEVRGAEALDMLKAWNTGHPGGLTTVHANSARGALYRLEQLVQEAVVTVPRRLIAEAIDILVFLEGRGSARRVTEVVKVEGLEADGDYALTSVFNTQHQAQ